MVYARAALLRPPFRIDAVNWDNPPPYFDHPDRNPLVRPRNSVVGVTHSSSFQPAASTTDAAPRLRNVRKVVRAANMQR